MQVIFVKPLNNECTLLIKVTIIPFPTMVIFFFLKSNLKNALYWGNHNGDVYFPHAYLLDFAVLRHWKGLYPAFFLFSPLRVFVEVQFKYCGIHVLSKQFDEFWQMYVVFIATTRFKMKRI